MLNLLGKIRKLCYVLCIRATGGKLTGDRMLRNGGNGCNHLKTSLLCGIFQFYQRVLIGAVAIDANQDGPGTVAMHYTQPLCRHSRHTATVNQYLGRGGERTGTYLTCFVLNFDLQNGQI